MGRNKLAVTRLMNYLVGTRSARPLIKCNITWSENKPCIGRRQWRHFLRRRRKMRRVSERLVAKAERVKVLGAAARIRSFFPPCTSFVPLPRFRPPLWFRGLRWGRGMFEVLVAGKCFSFLGSFPRRSLSSPGGVRFFVERDFVSRFFSDVPF